MNMTDAEVISLLCADTPLNRARRVFADQCGAMEQAGIQGMSPIEARRMEFEAVQKIADALGVKGLLESAQNNRKILDNIRDGLTHDLAVMETIIASLDAAIAGAV